MNPVYNTISELEAVTAEMAAVSDLGSDRFQALLDMRGALIRRLAGSELRESGLEFNDSRLVAIVDNAAQLHDRLQMHADSIRGDIARLEPARVLVAAVRSTFATPEPKGMDLSA